MYNFRIVENRAENMRLFLFNVDGFKYVWSKDIKYTADVIKVKKIL